MPDGYCLIVAAKTKNTTDADTIEKLYIIIQMEEETKRVIVYTIPKLVGYFR